jgi:hypothetical protein
MATMTKFREKIKKDPTPKGAGIKEGFNRL